MSNRLLYIVICLSVTPVVSAQLSPTQDDLGYINKVSLSIHTRVYLDSVLDGNTLAILSPDLKIRLATILDMKERKSLITASEKLEKLNYEMLEFRIGINQHFANYWRNLGKDILDTALQTNDICTIQFRNKGAFLILQETSIKRIPLTPKITKYKVDTTAYQIFHGDSISIAAGKNIELRWKKYWESKDSCILLRVKNGRGIIIRDWSLIGHVFNLKSLGSNDKYILECKYIDADSSSTYYIEILPFWYEYSGIRIGFILFFFFLIYIGFRVAKKIRSRQDLQNKASAKTQIRLIRNRLNPHWTFNSISSVIHLIGNQENEKAIEYLNGFSLLLRDSLDRNKDDIVSLGEDITVMDVYMTLELIKHGGSFNMVVDPSLDLDQIEFPYMLIQPSLENAIKHGIAGMGNQGVINLVYKQEGRDLLISVTDNGSEKPAGSKKGHGTGITEEWIKYLNKSNPAININYEMSHTKVGTIVMFRFENWITV